MLVELSILPLVGDGHLSDELAEVLKLIDSSAYRTSSHQPQPA